MTRYSGDASPDSLQTRASWNRQKAEVKAMLSLRETIERVAGVRFERTGSGFKARCPFHAERTPSFFVQEEQGRYKCFGAACGASGDVIQFLCDWHGIGFSEALEKAAGLAGLPPGGVGNYAQPSVRNEMHSAWRTVLGASQASPFEPRRPRPRMRPSETFLGTVPGDVRIPETGKPVFVHDPDTCRELCIRPTHVHVYRSEKAEVSCLVLRKDKAGGGKFFLQARWLPHENSPGSSSGRWALVRFPRDVPRPLYGLEDLRHWIAGGGTKMLFVEGEKARDAAARLLPVATTGILCLSSMGGANAVKFSEMHSLLPALGGRAPSTERPILHVWPDADPPVAKPGGKVVDRQRMYADDIASALHYCAVESGVDLRGIGIRRVVPPSGTANGWDLADALHQGWNTRRVLDRIDEYSLPVVGTDADKDASDVRPNCSASTSELDPTFF